jgi:hypothetical protein
VLLDSVDYVKVFPSIVVQQDLARRESKGGKEKYIKINSSGFSSVKVPDLIEKTYREAHQHLRL